MLGRVHALPLAITLGIVLAAGAILRTSFGTQAQPPIDELVHLPDGAVGATASGEFRAIAAYNGIRDGAGTRQYAPFVARDGHRTIMYLQNPNDGITVVIITFYRADGSIAATISDTIPPRGVGVYDQQNMVELSPGFLGSAVVTSDRPLAAVVNWYPPDGMSLRSYAPAYTGCMEPYVPLAMRNNGGYSNFLTVQNTGVSAAEVVVQYMASGSPPPVATQTATIQPGAASIFDLSTFTALGDRFVGSAQITSPQPVVVVVSLSTSLGAPASAYTVPCDACLSLAVPEQFRNSWTSGMMLANRGQDPANVVHNFWNADGALEATLADALPVGGSRTYYPYYWVPSGFNGASTIQSDQPVILLHTRLLPGISGDGLGRNPGICSEGLTDRAHLPRVARRVADGIYTELSVFNAGSHTTTASIHFYHVGGHATHTEPRVIPPHAVHRLSTQHITPLGDDWEGCVSITASGGVEIAASALQLEYEVAATPTPTRTSAPTATLMPTSTPFDCREPANNNREGACGPMMPSVVYEEYLSSASDEFDWFYFDMSASHSIEAWLTGIPPGCDYDLYLRRADGSHITSSANAGNADEHILWGPGSPGRYYLVVVQISGWSASVPYALRADFGQAAPTATPTSTRLPTSTPTRTPIIGPTPPQQYWTYLPVILK